MEEIKIDGVIESPNLELANGEGKDPLLALEHHRLKPFKKPELSEIEILIALPKNYREEKEFVIKLFDDLRDGLIPEDKSFMEKGYRCRWWGFKNVYDIDLEYEIKEYKYDENNFINGIFQLCEEASKKEILVVYIPLEYAHYIGSPYFKLKGFFIEKSIQSQMVLKKTFDRYFSLQRNFKNNPWENRGYGSLLWNISLSIFTKAGGIPWKLKEPIEDVSCFIGLATQMAPTAPMALKYKKQGIASVQLFNNWGEYEFSQSVEIDEMWRENSALCINEEKIKRLLFDILGNVDDKEGYVIVHVTDLYSEGVFSTIQRTVKDQGFEKMKIIRIQSEGPLRLYDTSSEKPSRGWPVLGTYWFLETNKIGELYTSGAWSYFPSPVGKPYAIPGYSITPVQVVLETPKEEALVTKDLRDILWLTNLHFYSQDIQRIKLPADLRLAKRLSKICASYDKPLLLPNITYLY